MLNFSLYLRPSNVLNSNIKTTETINIKVFICLDIKMLSTKSYKMSYTYSYSPGLQNHLFEMHLIYCQRRRTITNIDDFLL